METEIWKPYPSNELYHVSNQGNIHRITKKENVFIPCKFAHTGKYYSFFADGISKCVHMIVAETFISRPEGTDNVRHKNGDTHDNRVENLEWYTIQRKGGRPKKILTNSDPSNILPSSKSDQTIDEDYIIQPVSNTGKYAVFYRKDKYDMRCLDIYDSYEEAAESIL